MWPRPGPTSGRTSHDDGATERESGRARGGRHGGAVGERRRGSLWRHTRRGFWRQGGHGAARGPTELGATMDSLVGQTYTPAFIINDANGRPTTVASVVTG